jgi:Bacterial regulatory protein, Fis family
MPISHLRFTWSSAAGRTEQLTIAQIKNALALTINNVSATARMLGVDRSTIHNYIDKGPELQQHRGEVLAMLCDSARSNVYEDVVYEKNVRTSITVLEKNDPAWRNKQTVEHTGTIGVQAGVMSKDEIAALSDDDLQKMIAVRKAEQDDVRSRISRITAAGPTAGGDSDAT